MGIKHEDLSWGVAPVKTTTNKGSSTIATAPKPQPSQAFKTELPPPPKPVFRVTSLEVVIPPEGIRIGRHFSFKGSFELVRPADYNAIISIRFHLYYLGKKYYHISTDAILDYSTKTFTGSFSGLHYPDAFNASIEPKIVLVVDTDQAYLENHVSTPPIELPMETTALTLKKGNYDDTAVASDPNKYQAGTADHIPGDAIQRLQKNLVQFRFITNAHVTGYFGEITESAVKEFQEYSSKRTRRKSKDARLFEQDMLYSGATNGVAEEDTLGQVDYWKLMEYVKPEPEYMEREYDDEGVNNGFGKPGTDYYHKGRPIYELEGDLLKIGLYGGNRAKGYFGKPMRESVEAFQDAAVKGEFLVQGVLTQVGEKLTSIKRKGVIDGPTYKCIKKAVANGWKVPVTLQVVSIEGPEFADMTEKVIYTAKTNLSNLSETQAKSIKWCAKIKGEIRREWKEIGNKLELDIPDTWAGEKVQIFAYYSTSDKASVTTTVGLYCLFDGKKFTLFDKHNKPTCTFEGFSGTANQGDPQKELGPIPEGKYMISQKEIQKIPGMLSGEPNWEGGADAWGKERVQIYSFGAKTYGRMRFYIHGGKRKESGYGINLGENCEKFIDIFKKIGKDLVLVVRATQYENKSVDDQSINLVEQNENQSYNNKNSVNGINNSISLVKFSPGLDESRRKILSDKSKSILSEIAKKIGLEYITINSTIRFPHQQAEAMYNNLSAGKRLKYAAPGMAVTKVYDECKIKNFDKMTTIKKMTTEIEQLSKEGKRVSKHCVSESEYNKMNIIDIAIPSSKVKEFIIELANDPNVLKVFHDINGIEKTDKIERLAKEPCIHVEIKQ